MMLEVHHPVAGKRYLANKFTPDLTLTGNKVAKRRGRDHSAWRAKLQEAAAQIYAVTGEFLAAIGAFQNGHGAVVCGQPEVEVPVIMSG